MSEDGSIRWHRVRSTVRLLGEMRELGARTEAARKHLVDSLLRDMGAAIGVVVLDDAYRRGGKGGVADATIAGFDKDTLNVFKVHDSHGTDVNPYHRAVMDQVAALSPDEVQSAPVLSMNLSDVCSTRDWYDSFWVAECVQPARLDHFVNAVRVLGRDRVEGVGLMREARDRRFTDEDRNVLRLVVGEAGGLFRTRDEPALAPRVEATLKCMLTGASDKEIAIRLGISPHTVRQYVKVIYRAYGVSSRTELISRELSRTPPQASASGT